MTPGTLWRIRAVILATSLTTLVFFGGGGWALDHLFGTRPWMLVVGIIISFPLVNVLSIWFTRRFLASSL